MRCPLTLAAVVLVASPGHAEDATDAKAIVAKAVKAQGTPPDKPVAMTWKEKGTFSGSGIKMDFVSDWAFQAPDKMRFAMEGDFGGMKIGFLLIANGNKAWESGFGMKRESTGDKLEHAINQAYQLHVISLVPLLGDKEFKLSTAGEKDVGKKKTVGVKVTCDKRPAITLYFDKESGLLAKAEMKVKDEFQEWKEVLEETFLEDYKDVGTRKVFRKLRIVRDRKTMIEATLSDSKNHGKLDGKLFEKP